MREYSDDEIRARGIPLTHADGSPIKVGEVFSLNDLPLGLQVNILDVIAEKLGLTDEEYAATLRRRYGDVTTESDD